MNRTILTLITAATILTGCMGTGTTQQQPDTAQSAAVTASRPQEQTGAVRILLECAYFYASIAGAAQSSGNSEVKRAGQGFERTARGLAEAAARYATDKGFSTPEFKAISARADKGVRAHGRDYSGMLDYYGDDCRQVADAAKVR